MRGLACWDLTLYGSDMENFFELDPMESMNQPALFTREEAKAQLQSFRDHGWVAEAYPVDGNDQMFTITIHSMVKAPPRGMM